MMFGLESKHKVNVRRAMTRIMNHSFDVSEMHRATHETVEEKREDTRSQRLLSAFVFHIADKTFSSGGTLLTVIVTDLSCFGMSIAFPELVNVGDIFGIVLGDGDCRHLLKGRCVRVQSLGMGACRAGIQLIEVLKENEYTAILDYADAMDSHAEAFMAYARQ